MHASLEYLRGFAPSLADATQHREYFAWLDHSFDRTAMLLLRSALACCRNPHSLGCTQDKDHAPCQLHTG